MKKRPAKNPTMKEMKNVVSNLIREMSYIQQYIANMDSTFYRYILFNKDEVKFKKWLAKEAKKEAKEAKKEVKDDKSSDKNKK